MKWIASSLILITASIITLMTHADEPRLEPKGKITSAATMLIVEDVRKAAEFYRDKMGFQIESIFEGSPTNPTRYAMISRDGLEIHLESYEGFIEDYREFAKARVKCGVYFTVDDVDALHAEFKRNGIEAVYPPTDQTYGIRDMKIKDLDGYQLLFGTPR